MQHLLYMLEPRAVLVEQSWRVISFDGRQHVYGWHTERCVYVNDEGATRGQKGMYPYLPACEPVTVDQATFDEAWEGADG